MAAFKTYPVNIFEKVYIVLENKIKNRFSLRKLFFNNSIFLEERKREEK